MKATSQLKNQHLLWRAAFGPAVAQLDELDKSTPQHYYKLLVKNSQEDPQYIDVAEASLADMYDKLMDVGRRANLTEEERKELAKKQREAIRNLNLRWLNEIINSKAQLREKMAFFWHGHFASRNNNLLFNQLLLHTIRKNALGNFDALLKEVSRSASMLFFLNNQQNKKGHANENFAREVMELFTLGRGNYTENDIKEAARAFTGWTADRQGGYVFRKGQHDDGFKQFLGRNGNFEGEDILNIILENKQTARFITKKIYRFFVNENADEKITSHLSEKFYKSGYDISKLMEEIFMSDWFYSESNIGARIKSPIELLAGMQRMVPMQLENDQPMMYLQRLLGQQLLYPPNVAGWPGGKSWIDSSTLMLRMRIPQMFADKDELNVTPKQDDDQMMGRKSNGEAAVPIIRKNAGGLRLINAKIDWPQYTSKFSGMKRENLLPAIKNYLLQSASPGIEQVIEESAELSSREAYIKSITMRLMSLPEYQLC